MGERIRLRCASATYCATTGPSRFTPSMIFAGGIVPIASRNERSCLSLAAKACRHNDLAPAPQPEG